MINYITHPKLRFFFLVILFFIFLGVVVFSAIESWSIVDSLYFTVSTMTTVGFGDIVPTHDTSKLLATFYMMLTVPLILISVGLVTEVVHDNLQKRIEERKKKR